MADDLFTRLDAWYAEQCDGEWEHEFGIKIQTLDNPGWLIQVDLSGTGSEGATLPANLDEDESGTWVHSSADGTELRVACSPRAMEKAMRVVLEFLSA